MYHMKVYEPIFCLNVCGSHARSLNSSKARAQSTIFFPFSFKSEERAAKRNEARLDYIVIFISCLKCHSSLCINLEYFRFSLNYVIYLVVFQKAGRGKQGKGSEKRPTINKKEGLSRKLSCGMIC